MPQENQPTEGEKKEFLKREEISTMEKEVAGLRENEAQKEKERIASLNTEGKPVPPSPPSGPQEKNPEEPGLLIPKSAGKNTAFLKIIIRAGIIIFFFLIGLSIYWFLFVNNSAKESPQKNEPANNEPLNENPPETVIPAGGEATSSEPEEENPPAEEEPQDSEPEKETGPSIINRILSWGHYTPKTPRTIDTLIIHSAYNALGGDVYSVDKVIEEFRIYKVASHYLIDRNGIIYSLAPEKDVAYHAGTGVMPDGARKNVINNFSIGIELIYKNTDSPSPAQYEALAELTRYLKNNHPLISNNILGHENISSTKTDPWNFDWEYFDSLIE